MKKNIVIPLSFLARSLFSNLLAFLFLLNYSCC